MQKSDFLFILKSFLIWRLGLFVILFFAIKFLPNQTNFLGGGLQNYSAYPYLWAWANFDGEHYLSIAARGYGFGEEPFFPLYPILIKLFGGSVISALLISNILFFIALIGLYKLLRLNYREKVTRMALVLLLLFPTSFYFGSVYSESLFLAIVVWFFFFLRKKKWFQVLILGTLASSARLVGLALLVPFGLFTYMLYLLKLRGDPLVFIHNITIFGEQRSTTPILLPQVFYRYFFRIIPNLNYSYFPVVFTTFLELSVAILFLILLVLGFKKIRFFYFFYALTGYLLPTLSGSFSSLPRYALVLFPLFVVAALILRNTHRFLRIMVYILMGIALTISTALFLRGYWVS